MADVPGLVPELARVDLEAASADEVLETLAADSLAAGYVRDSFGEAVREREQAFPTGLPTPVPTAIPHVDTDHVVRPGLVPVRLASPVVFAQMGGGGSDVPVELVVLLLVTDRHAQVPTLGALLQALQRPELRSVVCGGDGHARPQSGRELVTALRALL